MNFGGLAINMTPELYSIGMRKNVFAFVSAVDSLRAGSLARLPVDGWAIEESKCVLLQIQYDAMAVTLMFP